MSFPSVRESPPKEIEIHDNVDPPFSIYEFVEKDFYNSCTLHRILSQMRMKNFQTLVVEKINFSKDVIEENNDIKKYFPTFSESQVIRLSFFNKKFSSLKELEKIDSSSFLGVCSSEN